MYFLEIIRWLAQRSSNSWHTEANILVVPHVELFLGYQAQALARIPRKYPQKGYKLHVLDWGMPRVNGYGEPESLMDFTGKAEASVLASTAQSSTDSVATSARVAGMTKDTNE